MSCWGFICMLRFWSDSVHPRRAIAHAPSIRDLPDLSTEKRFCRPSIHPSIFHPPLLTHRATLLSISPLKKRRVMVGPTNYFPSGRTNLIYWLHCQLNWNECIEWKVNIRKSLDKCKWHINVKIILLYPTGSNLSLTWPTHCESWQLDGQYENSIWKSEHCLVNTKVNEKKCCIYVLAGLQTSVQLNSIEYINPKGLSEPQFKLGGFLCPLAVFDYLLGWKSSATSGNPGQNLHFSSHG